MKSALLARVSKIESGKKRHMKCIIQVSHRTSLLKDIIIIPSLSLVSFSWTSTLITFERGSSKEIIISRANTKPTAVQNPWVKFSGLGNSAVPIVRILTLSAYLQLPLDWHKVLVAMKLLTVSNIV